MPRGAGGAVRDGQWDVPTLGMAVLIIAAVTVVAAYFRRDVRRRSIRLLRCGMSSRSQIELALQISTFYRLGNRIGTSQV